MMPHEYFSKGKDDKPGALRSASSKPGLASGASSPICPTGNRQKGTPLKWHTPSLPRDSSAHRSSGMLFTEYRNCYDGVKEQ